MDVLQGYLIGQLQLKRPLHSYFYSSFLLSRYAFIFFPFWHAVIVIFTVSYTDGTQSLFWLEFLKRAGKPSSHNIIIYTKGANDIFFDCCWVIIMPDPLSAMNRQVQGNNYDNDDDSDDVEQAKKDMRASDTRNGNDPSTTIDASDHIKKEKKRRKKKRKKRLEPPPPPPAPPFWNKYSTAFVLLAVIVVIVMIVVPCALILPNKNAPAPLEQGLPADTLQAVQQRGHLLCGVEVDDIGRSSIDNTTGQRIGFNVDLVSSKCEIY